MFCLNPFTPSPYFCCVFIILGLLFSLLFIIPISLIYHIFFQFLNLLPILESSSYFWSFFLSMIILLILDFSLLWYLILLWFWLKISWCSTIFPIHRVCLSQQWQIFPTSNKLAPHRNNTQHSTRFEHEHCRWTVAESNTCLWIGCAFSTNATLYLSSLNSLLYINPSVFPCKIIKSVIPS